MPLVPDLPAQRQASQVESALPKFIVMRLEGEDAIVECPRQRGRCGEQFIVHLPTWVTHLPNTYGRSCPYCFKVSQIPPSDILDHRGESIR